MFSRLKSLFQPKPNVNPNVNPNNALLFLQEAHIRLLRDYSNQIAHLRAAQKGLRRLQRRMKRVLKEQNGQGISGAKEPLFGAPVDAPEPDVSTLPSLFVNGVFFARLTADCVEPKLFSIEPKHDWLELKPTKQLTHACLLSFLLSTVSSKVFKGEEATYSVVAGNKTYTARAVLLPTYTKSSLRDQGIQKVHLLSKAEAFEVTEHAQADTVVTADEVATNE